MTVGTVVRNKKRGTLATIIMSGEMTGVYCLQFQDGVKYTLTAQMLRDRFEVVP